MTKELKSLEAFNSEKSQQWYATSAAPHAKPNGIACPLCGKEMVDTNPNAVLASSPPKKDVACTSCGYTGYRVA